MTRREEIDMEIRNQAARLYPKCCARFELPGMVYTKIIVDNDLRKKPYRVSFERVEKIVSEMDFERLQKEQSKISFNEQQSVISEQLIDTTEQPALEPTDLEIVEPMDMDFDMNI